MTYLLHIETSTTNCSVSISKNGELIALKEEDKKGYSHSEKLHVFIVEVLKTVNISFEDLSGVAVGKGPGSYTGLRIGVAAAKGLCYGLDIPLIAINSLEILAQAYTPKQNELIIPMLDARRDEVYTAVFNEKKEYLKDTNALILKENSLTEFTQKNTVVVIGNAQEKCKKIVNDKAILYKDEIINPSAKWMSKISYDAFIQKQFEDIAYFEPFYLKEFYTTAKINH